jgi:hypothetical protein
VFRAGAADAAIVLVGVALLVEGMSLRKAHAACGATTRWLNIPKNQKTRYGSWRPEAAAGSQATIQHSVTTTTFDIQMVQQVCLAAIIKLPVLAPAPGL